MKSCSDRPNYTLCVSRLFTECNKRAPPIRPLFLSPCSRAPSRCISLASCCSRNNLYSACDDNARGENHQCTDSTGDGSLYWLDFNLWA
jgi:hypothetical protein